MTELLNALGVRGRRVRAVTACTIWVGFGGAMAGIAAGQALIERLLHLRGLFIVLIVVSVWVMWTFWHSVSYLRHRERYLRHDRRPYRHAFLVDIFPAISVGFSQMLRPAWNGANLRMGRVFPHVPQSPFDLASVLSGWALAVGSFALFASAWATLGAARVGFVQEFLSPEAFEPIRRGPYGHVRHPLFWSGIGISWSLALISSTPVALVIASVNTGYGFVYNRLEDRRLGSVFGRKYADYASEVPHIVPAASMRRLIVRSATGRKSSELPKESTLPVAGSHVQLAGDLPETMRRG